MRAKTAVGCSALSALAAVTVTGCQLGSRQELELGRGQHAATVAERGERILEARHCASELIERILLGARERAGLALRGIWSRPTAQGVRRQSVPIHAVP